MHVDEWEQKPRSYSPRLRSYPGTQGKPMPVEAMQDRLSLQRLSPTKQESSLVRVRSPRPFRRGEMSPTHYSMQHSPGLNNEIQAVNIPVGVSCLLTLLYSAHEIDLHITIQVPWRLGPSPGFSPPWTTARDCPYARTPTNLNSYESH